MNSVIRIVILLLSLSLLPLRVSGQGAAAPPARPLKQLEDGAKVNVAILLFPGVQIIDYTGPYEVFGHSNFETFTVAESLEPLTTSYGMTVLPKYTFGHHPKPDVLLIPGGNVPDHADDATLQWIRANAADARIVLSVCNGAFFLAQGGLLDGLKATTFAGLIDSLKKTAERTNVVSNERYVDNGKVITTAGLSSGIDGALHVVERLQGRPWARAIATTMEYNWDPESTYVRAQLADRKLEPAMAHMRRYERDLVRFEGNTRSWTIAWNLKSDETPKALLASMSEDMVTAQGWQAGRSHGDQDMSWTFKDDQNRAWIARAEAAPIPGNKDQLKVELSVRVDGAVPSAAKQPSTGR